LITTATAIFLGVNSVLYRVLGTPGGLSGGPVLMRSMFRLPLFLVWLIAAVWVYERRDRLKSSGVVLTALVLMLAWETVSDPLSMAVILRMTPAPGSVGQILIMALNLFSMIVMIAGWVLVLVAYARSNERPVDLEADEELSGPLSLLRE